MSVSIAPVSTAQVHVVPTRAVKSETNRSDSANGTPHAQSADPRSTKNVSHRQNDALLNLASADHVKNTSPHKSETQNSTSVQAANRAFQAIQRG